MITFDEWWEKESGWGGEQLAEYHLAKSAWDAAKPRWIPMNEQLPTEIKPHVIKLLDRHCPVIRIWSGNLWYNIGDETVTHWMELPE